MRVGTFPCITTPHRGKCEVQRAMGSRANRLAAGICSKGAAAPKHCFHAIGVVMHQNVPGLSILGTAETNKDGGALI
jgi:hypothetical protein